MRKVDLAYAAGIIDGEGCISIIKNKDPRCRRGFSYRMNVQVGMGYKEIPEWLYKSFGGRLNIVKREYATYRREISMWGLSAQEALRFLYLISPYLKEKSEQAKIAIEFQKGKRFGAYVSDLRMAKEAIFHGEIRQLKKIGQILYER